MIINNHSNVIFLITSTLSAGKFSCLKESRKKFILTILLCFLSIKDRINFSQLARFSGFCEQFFRIHFENKFDFQSFNLSLILQQKINECIIAFDPSYIRGEWKINFRGKQVLVGLCQTSQMGLGHLWLCHRGRVP